MDIINSFYKNESEKFFLNYSMTRSLQAVLDSAYPTLKIVFRLSALDHNCYVEFSNVLWNTLTEKGNEVISALDSLHEKVIFIDDEIKVFTERMHGKCAVCFLDQNNVRVNMMVKTFENMLKKSYKITTAFKDQYNFMKKTAENMKKFVTFVLQQHNQCDANNRQFNKLFTEIQQYSNALCNSLQPEVHSSFSFDDDFYEECDEPCEHCRQNGY